MSSPGLMGRQVHVTFTDPWDFVTENGAQTSGLVTEARGRNELVIQLEQDIRSNGRSSRLLTARPRHRGAQLGELTDGGEVGCNFLVIADGRSERPLGQVLFSAIGSVRI